MKRLLNAIWTVLSSRTLPPLVCGVFLLTYIGIAFGTDDTLIALMAFTRTSSVLVVLLALIPLNSLCRMLLETYRHHKRRRAVNCKEVETPYGLFDESVTVPALPTFAELEERLNSEGYRCRRTERTLAAWRGISLFPARMIFLAAVFCLFAGILISLTTRSSRRMNVIEGEPLPTAKGGGGLVERISLMKSSGAILDKDLIVEVAQSDAGDGRKIFGLYPPSLYRGYFVYPRYLWIASVIRFSAPDIQPAYEKQSALNIHPPGKEDRLEIPGSPYQIFISLVKPDDGSDPYMTGRITFLFKILKGKNLLFTGSVPTGGEFVQDGYRLAIPDSRRMVKTDFIQDYGVLLIWTAAILFICSGCVWLPVAVFLPRREMVFVREHDVINAFSRTEGRRRIHAGVFHEALDLLEARQSTNP